MALRRRCYGDWTVARSIGVRRTDSGTWIAKALRLARRVRPDRYGTFFEQLGFRPGRLFAAAAGLTEVLGGVLVVAGFGGPIGPAFMVSVMIVAVVSVHWGHGLFAATNGIEVPLLYAASAAALALTGFGRYSLDALFDLTSMWTTANAGMALGLAAFGAIANLAARRSAVPSNVHA